MHVCGNCLYARHDVNDDGSVSVRCHRYPPTQLELGSNLLKHGEVFGMGWCGEYQEGEIDYQKLLNDAARWARKRS